MFKSNFLVQDFRAVLSMLHLAAHRISACCSSRCPLGCACTSSRFCGAARCQSPPLRCLLLPRAFSAACAHKLSMLRRSLGRRPGVRVGCAPARASSRVAASHVMSHPPVTACCHLHNKKFAHERRYERTRTLHRTNNRTGGSGELLRAMFHNHCHASNRRIHQAPVCDKCQIARF